MARTRVPVGDFIATLQESEKVPITRHPVLDFGRVTEGDLRTQAH